VTASSTSGVQDQAWPGRRAARSLAAFAIASQFAFVTAWVVAGALEPSYSHLEEGVSALSARDAAHPWIVAAGLVLLGGSFTGLALALRAILPRRRAALACVVSLLLAGLALALAGVLPLDCSPLDERCGPLDVGEVSWQHLAHLWLSPLIQLSLLASGVALVRVLWPRPAGLALLGGVATAVLFTLAMYPLYEVEAAPNGLVQRVAFAIVHGWAFLLAGAILWLTRPLPSLPRAAPIRPREFYGGSWRGEGQVLARPLFLWRRLGPRFLASREVEWLTDKAFVVEDSAEFQSGHMEVRRRFCELIAADTFRVIATDLLEPTMVRIDEGGFAVAPYRIRVPYGPFGVTLRCRDELRVEADGALVNEIRMSLLALPVARVVVRARGVAAAEGGDMAGARGRAA
jgi:hypothetical protein